MRKYAIILLLAAGIFITGCQTGQKDTDPVKIAITKTNDYYSALVERNRENTVWINLYGLPVDSALLILGQCDGLLVTGGEDVYPGLYGKLSDTARCEGFDRYRDSLELASIAYALEQKMPVFGICRGLQILNVALNGTLIIDIPTDFDTVVKHRLKDWKKCFHEVTTIPNTLLNKLSNTASDTVNSAHHQGIDHLGNGLRISAYAYDSLPEAIEWAERNNNGFLMATQWHPERLDPDHPLSKNLAVAFLHEAETYHQNH
ncbi:MAG: hypothetical protein DRJ02_02425 [Bacteroidetes bacterium]|nr:MAG: hypothetical protein DRJ02_02425 [Bacteroidota bacterium]